jgi:dTDP-4-amino-4,6-dideoxygalactose transaminase
MNFQELFDFEKALAEYTGAPYVVLTDGCTHAIEMCMKYDKVTECQFPARTYVSVLMIMEKLKINYQMTDDPWLGEYKFEDTRIWDSARRFEPNMYQPGQMQCVSFGWSKPLVLGKVGAILLDDYDAYVSLSMMRSDGRDLRISPWQVQENFSLGFHYCPTLESCIKGLALLPTVIPQRQEYFYPDLRNITIVD